MQAHYARKWEGRLKAPGSFILLIHFLLARHYRERAGKP